MVRILLKHSVSILKCLTDEKCIRLGHNLENIYHYFFQKSSFKSKHAHTPAATEKPEPKQDKKGGKWWSKVSKWNPFNCRDSRAVFASNSSSHSLRTLKQISGVKVHSWFSDIINIVCLSSSKNRLLPVSQIFGYAHYCLLEWKAKGLTEAFLPLLWEFPILWKKYHFMNKPCESTNTDHTPWKQTNKQTSRKPNLI